MKQPLCRLDGQIQQALNKGEDPLRALCPVPDDFNLRDMSGVDTRFLDRNTWRYIETLSHTPFLTGQVVVLTGGASGVGEKFALMAAAAGATVIALDIAPSITSKYPSDSKITGMRVDITDQDEVVRTMAQINERYGGIHKLALIAGIFPDRPKLGELNVKDMKRSIAVNYEGAAIVGDAALPHMMSPGGKGKDPAIVLMLTKNMINPSHSIYAAAKGALLEHSTYWSNKLHSEAATRGGDSARILSVLSDNLVDTKLWGDTEDERRNRLSESAKARGQSLEQFLEHPNNLGDLLTSWKAAATLMMPLHPVFRGVDGATHHHGASLEKTIVF